MASRGDWLAISAAAEVSYKTLWRFANGLTTRPWGQFLANLDAHFQRVDARREKPYRGTSLQG